MSLDRVLEVGATGGREEEAEQIREALSMLESISGLDSSETRLKGFPKQRTKLGVLIPAFDEAESIGRVIQDIPRDVAGIEEVFIIVVDDGSNDNTHEVAIRKGADHVVRHERNQGLGVAFRNGLQLALRLGADVIVNIDGDDQYSGPDIPALVAPIVNDEADVVLGDRQVDSLDHMSPGRRLGNRIATWTVRRLSGANVPDGQTGFRAFSRDAALRLNLTGRYTHVHEVIIQAAKHGLRISSVPISFRARKGQSRLIKGIWSYATRAGSIMLRTYMHYEPLRTFAIIGLTFILLGLIFGSRVLFHFSSTGMVTPFIPSAIVAAVSGIIGLQLIVLGLVGEVLARNRELTEEALYRLRRLEMDGRLKSITEEDD